MRVKIMWTGVYSKAVAFTYHPSSDITLTDKIIAILESSRVHLLSQYKFKKNVMFDFQSDERFKWNEKNSCMVILFSWCPSSKEAVKGGVTSLVAQGKVRV